MLLKLSNAIKIIKNRFIIQTQLSLFILILLFIIINKYKGLWYKLKT